MPTAPHGATIIDVPSTFTRGMPTLIQHPSQGRIRNLPRKARHGVRATTLNDILVARDRAFNALLDRISDVLPSRFGHAADWRRDASRPSPTKTKNYTLTPPRKATKVLLTRVSRSPMRRGED